MQSYYQRQMLPEPADLQTKIDQLNKFLEKLRRG
jgi:hypothetical protein